jgi:hypothetical protein
MKPIKFITTFSKIGYEVYGKTWIKTFSDNVKDTNVSVDIYVDFPITVTDDRINLIDYEFVIKSHKDWLKDFESKYNGPMYNKKMAMRFSYKSFVMQHALENNSNCYLVWLDGDCIFKVNQNFCDFQESLLNQKFIAVQREHNGGDDHCESGFVLFDTDHKDKEKFNTQFKNNYKIENVVNMHSPYDGFIIYKSLSGIEYVDLNDGYGKGGIQSDPTQTFLHPEVYKRFLHNIGFTGKSKYDSWETYYSKDEYLKLINGRAKKTPEQIKSIRQKLIEIRNKR